MNRFNRLNEKKMMELMKEYCGGNYNRFAREMGIDASQLHRFLNSGVGGGKMMVFGLMKFCKEKKLDVTDYMA